MASSKYQFQASKSNPKGLSPVASMTDTTLCQVCYPKGLPASKVTSHHPRGRWDMVSKDGKALKVCTRHSKALLAEGGKVATGMARALSAASKAKASKASKASSKASKA
jgi:hypothetical protein